MDLRSNHSYSIAQYGNVANYPALQQDTSVDIAVIGAGISGALVAYALTPDHNVCIIDKREVGKGSTAASTSLLQYELDRPLHELAAVVGKHNAIRSYKLCEQAIFELKDISNNVAPGLEFNLQPSLQFATYKTHVERLQREHRFRKENNFDVHWLSQEQLAQQYHLDAPAAMRSNKAGSVDAYMLTHKILQHCSKHGLKVFEKTGVTNIEHHRDGMTLHTTTGYKVVAKKLIMACGYESLQYIRKSVAQLYTTYALASRPLEQRLLWQDRSLIWETSTPYMYARTTSDNRIIVGGLDDKFTDPELRESLLQRKANQLAQKFHRRFPHISIKPAICWGGVFASTTDSLPYIGTLPGRPHTYFALGFGGNGITFSQVAANILRDAIDGRHNQDKQLFSFNRHVHSS